MRKLYHLPALAFLFYVSICNAQQGKDGAKVISAANVIVNESTSLTANATAGNTSITVSNSTVNFNSRFAGPLAPGDLIMIIQMQGATINGPATDSTWGDITSYNNCGLYEFAEVAGTPNGTTIKLSCALKNNYTAAGNVQVVRVPRYISLTINNGGILTGDAWNGATGGIVAVEVQNNTVINTGGSMVSTGIGFRGGLVQNNNGGTNNTGFASDTNTLGGAKGEGVAGYETGYNIYGGMFGRGAPANGGGGGDQWNASGGGGGNAGNINNYTGDGNPDITTDTAWITAWNLEYNGFAHSTSSGGGRGGYSIEWFPTGTPSPLVYPPGNVVWGSDGNDNQRNRENVGGKGGRPLDYSTGRIFAGGGGGAGHEDQGLGGSGGIGGGIVYLLSYGTVSGGGSITANGQNGLPDNSTGNLGDGCGGAGAGGTVIIYSANTISEISISANGGNGGNQYISSSYENEGPGGGGGGGYIATSSNTSGISSSAEGGVNGTTNSPLMTLFPPDGATKGGNGFSNQVINSAPFSSVIANISSAVSICPGASTVLSASGGTTYSWSPSANLSCDTCSNPIANPAVTTTYVVTISSGSCNGVDSVVVTIMNTADAGVISSPKNPICQGASTSLFLTGTSGNLQWQFSTTGNNFSNIPGADSTAYLIQPAQTAYYRVWADSGSCSDTSVPYILVVYPLPIPPVLSTSDSTICSPDSALINTSGTYSSYRWNDGDTTRYIYTTSTGDYWVTVTDINGCTAVSGQQGITVFPVLPPPVIITNDSLICSSDSTRINVVGNYSSYLWNNDATTPYTVVNNAGDYWVTVTDVNGCSAVSVQQAIYVFPVPSVSILVQGNTLASFNAVSYQWIFDDSIISGATGSVYAANQSGNYAVQVIDSNGCTAISNSTYITTGIAALFDNSSLDIYPDPAVNYVYISFSGENFNEVRVINSIGQEIKRLVINKNDKTVKMNISELPAGVYELMFYRGEQFISGKPFIHETGY